MRKFPSYEEIVEASLEILRQYDTPITLRQLYYRLVSRRMFPNTLNSYKRLSRTMVRARERGDIPLSAIEDRSRRILGRGDVGYSSVEEFLRRRIKVLVESWKEFTMPMWEDQPYYLLISLEKDALSRLVSQVANRYAVRTFPTKGYPSFSYVLRMAHYIRGRLKGKTTIILYLGDFDPSGVDIERDLTERLRRYGAGDFIVKRIALTRDQILEYQLPPMPVKRSDARAPRFVAAYGDEAVELDALDPNVLRRVITAAIEEYIDVELWKKREKEIEELKGWLRERLRSIEDVILD
jgi:hypothetical protein